MSCEFNVIIRHDFYRPEMPPLPGEAEDSLSYDEETLFSQAAGTDLYDMPPTGRN